MGAIQELTPMEKVMRATHARMTQAPDMPLSYRPRKYPGMLIVLEGMDGAGKSTIAERLKVTMESTGTEVVKVRTPGGTELGEELREILLNTKEDLGVTAEAFIFQAQLSHCIETVIKPALREGKMVICDRLVLSTFAYQGMGRGMNLQFLWTMQGAALDGVWPDLILLLNYQKKEESDGTRMEEAGEEFIAKVRYYYDNLVKTNPLTKDFVIPIEVEDEIGKTMEKVMVQIAGTFARIHEMEKED